VGPEVSAKVDDASFEASRPLPSPPRPGTTMLGNGTEAVAADEDELHDVREGEGPARPNE